MIRTRIEIINYIFNICSFSVMYCNHFSGPYHTKSSILVNATMQIPICIQYFRYISNDFLLLLYRYIISGLSEHTVFIIFQYFYKYRSIFILFHLLFSSFSEALLYRDRKCHWNIYINRGEDGISTI